MRTAIIPAALAIAVAAFATPAAAQSPGYPPGWNGPPPGTYQPYQPYQPYGVRPRPYVEVTPYATPYARGGWVPYELRGFNDPGYAYHGNLNGCAVDLGYGRWEPCR
jgi:hypothetical protein